MENLIGKRAVVTTGVNEGKSGKILQQRDDWVLIEIPGVGRQGYKTRDLVIE